MKKLLLIFLVGAEAACATTPKKVKKNKKPASTLSVEKRLDQVEGKLSELEGRMGLLEATPCPADESPGAN